MVIKHEIAISSDELKSLTKIISQEKKLGFELIGIRDSEAIYPLACYRYILTFSETLKKGGEKK